MPAWSPDGSRIAYSGEASGVFQIFTRKIGASVPTQITHQDASCFLPFWSPDGSRVYYILSRSFLDRSLWSSAVAGGEAEKILDGVHGAGISPDGKTLALEVVQPDKTRTVMLSSPPGAQPRPLPQGEIPGMRDAIGSYSMQFTKDGRYLGVLLDGSGKVELWKIPLNGGTPQEVLHGHYISNFLGQFNWFHDDSVIWSWQGEGDGHVVMQDLRRGTDREITQGIAQEKYATLSPDDRTLAFQAGESGYHLFEVPLSGTPPSRVPGTERDEVAPSWAPDGLHFAYSTNRDGYSEIWLRNRTDGSERQIVSTRDFAHRSGGDQFLDCAISPDGSRVAYRYESGSGVTIWISFLAGDTPVPLYQDPNNEWQRGPSWSPGGNWIAYYSSHNGKTAMMKTRVGSTRPPELVTYIANPSPVRWSPRGDWIAWDDDNKLTLVSPDGKQRRVLSEKTWFTYGWSKTGDSLLGTPSESRRHVRKPVSDASVLSRPG